ncbi:MAG: 50S ribosomal protein L17 [Actinobacteria bacterium]|nr:50S ribosomal protein L17 [Actinomycetota bacterium]
MRHRVAHRKLNRTSAHRLAMRRSLVLNLIEHESIITTLPKAKEIKSFAEKLITLARNDTVTARRRAVALLNDRRLSDEDAEHKTVVSKLFKVLGPRFADRPGGYTRIVRLAGRRLGDGSVKVVLQFVDQALASTGVRRRRTTKSGSSGEVSSKSAAKPAAKPAEKAEKAEGKTPQDAESAESDSSSGQPDTVDQKQ